MKIGIINSGGDVSGINAVIASIVKAGRFYNDEFVGFIKGWEGLLNPMKFITLDLKTVRNISHIGGTILLSTNKGRFAGKVGEGQANHIPLDILNEAKTNLKKLEIDAIIVIGGDGTLMAALQLAEIGVNVVGVPKTIDNDLMYTDRTFGFSTAVDVIVDALSRLHTTAASHERVFVIETMGRHTGWLALEGGLGGGASAIIIPEVKFSYNQLYDFIKLRKKKGKNYSLIVVAEGATSMDGGKVLSKVEAKSEVQLGGIANEMTNTLLKLSKNSLEIRSLVLGHLQRGGTPNSTDIILSQEYGAGAIKAVHFGEFGKMVALKGNKIKTEEISKAVKGLKFVSESDTAFQTAKSLGIFLGQTAV